MKTSWTKGLTPEKQEEIKREFKSSSLLRERLAVLVQDKIDASIKASRSKDEYANSNWAYLQADARGYERALSEVISLISGEK